jgi:plastocyanin
MRTITTAALLILTIAPAGAWVCSASTEQSEAVSSCILCLPSIGEPEASTAKPAIAPAVTRSIRGTIAISGGLYVQRPDLSRAVVYLASAPALDAAAPPSEPAIVSQKNKSFVPSMLAIARGMTVEFPNLDDFDHNVFSRSKAAPAFDLDRYPKGLSKSRVFDKTGIVQVFCNIHPQMRAMIFVTPNRYFARADDQGRFEIASIPPGSYELVVWHQRCAEQRVKVDITSGDAENIAVKIEESRDEVMANDPPRRDAGYGVARGLGIKREQLDLPVVTESHPAPAAPK